MKELILTPFNESGYSRLAEYLRRASRRALLPIPRAYCEGRIEEIERRLPSTLVSTWRHVADIILKKQIEDPICYLEEVEIKDMVESGIKLAVLVYKSRVFGRIDIDEWISLVRREPKPRFTSWRGSLVVDKYSEYYILVRANVEVDRVVQVDLFAPTPLDLLYLCSARLARCVCSLVEIVQWAVKYIGEYVMTSPNTSVAYRRLVSSPEYRDFIEKCFPVDDVLHYWSWSVHP